jgi:predicted negative regulator of RcsB-dependent stress response
MPGATIALALMATIPQPSQHRSSHPVPAQVIVWEEQYRHAIALYRSGNAAEAIDTVRQIPTDRIMAVVARLKQFRNEDSAKPPDPLLLAYGWPRTFIFAGGLLAGDAALADLNADADGFEDQLAVAVNMLQTADMARPRTTDKALTYTRDWMRAFAALLMANNYDSKLNEVLQYEERFFPDDGPLELTRGMFEEFESQAPVTYRFYTNSYGLQEARDLRNGDLKHAATALEHALRAMPDSDEARARLAHVRIALHHDSDAVPLLETGVSANEPQWAYLSMVMLGDVHARRGDVPGAEGLYRRAIERSGGAQSAYVALALTQYRAADREAAAATLDALYALARAHRSPVDPWWTYPLGTPDAARKALEQLRAEARQ